MRFKAKACSALLVLLLCLCFASAPLLGVEAAGDRGMPCPQRHSQALHVPRDAALGSALGCAVGPAGPRTQEVSSVSKEGLAKRRKGWEGGNTRFVQHCGLRGHFRNTTARHQEASRRHCQLAQRAATARRCWLSSCRLSCASEIQLQISDCLAAAACCSLWCASWQAKASKSK